MNSEKVASAVYTVNVKQLLYRRQLKCKELKMLKLKTECLLFEKCE